ncbi:MAG: SCO family protein [Neisseriaceae bacterium]|nr:SCO family protein [Neisseriaceae bacterium]
MSFRTILAPLALGSLAILSACSGSEPTATPTAQNAVKTIGSDISAENIGAPFTLTGQNGDSVSLSDFAGKVVLLSFGYTHCPDICPTNLLTYAQSMSLLTPEEQEKVAVVMISVDPERDTPAVLGEYVTLFNPQFVGLSSADPATLNQVLQDYKIVATRVERDDGDYVMDHSTGSYLIDAKGQARLYEPHGISAEDLTHDLKTLLE